MKRTLKYALSAVLCFGVIAPVLAQEGKPVPPDVPETHWAYDALKNMFEKGLLMGYPDGMFRGGRMATRYEMAVAIYATYTHLMRMNNNLESMIKALDDKINNLPKNTGGNTNTGQDYSATIRELRNQLAQLKADQDAMKKWGGEIDNLKKAAQVMEKELSRLGVEVSQMMKDLGDLSDRVSKLEKRMNVDIHGDVNFFTTMGFSQSGDFGLTVDGRPVGVGRNSYNGAAVSGLRNLTVLHEASVSLSSPKESKGPRWWGTFVFGNMVGATNPSLNPVVAGSGGFVNQAGRPAALTAFSDQGRLETYIQTLGVILPFQLMGHDMNVTVGRQGYQTRNPYVLKRPDTTPYYKNERWDNGDYNFDGAKASMNFGSVMLDVVAGRTSNNQTTNGFVVNPLVAGQVAVNPTNIYAGTVGQNAVNVDQMYLANATLPIADKAKIGLTYMYLDSNTVSGAGTAANPFRNGVEVFGADLGANIGPLVFNGYFSQSNVRMDKTQVVKKDNKAYEANLAYNKAKWGVKAGYRRVEPLFAAPGDWGRIGTWWNPADSEAFTGSIWLKVNDKLGLRGGVMADQGLGKTINGVAGRAKGDKVTSFNVAADYMVSSNWAVMLGYEAAEWKFNNVAGKPLEQWFTLGLKNKVSDNAWWNVMLQYSDYNGKNVATGLGPRSAFRNRGTLLTSQVSVRF